MSLYEGDNENLTPELVSKIESGKNIFITGGAGTGKSSLLLAIYNKFKNIRQTYITSSTGVSAINVKGTTIHSWSGIKAGKEPVDKIVECILHNNGKNGKVLERWKTCKLLLLDEVSMIGLRTFELLSNIGSKINNISVPFGGIQLIFFGDFFQLPPVNDDYIFNSKVWKSLDINIVKLHKAYRFTDLRYYELLQRARVGQISKEDEKLLQKRVDCYKNLPRDSFAVKPTILYSLNTNVDEINNCEMKKLQTKEYKYVARDTYTGRNKLLMVKRNLQFELDDLLEPFSKKILTLKQGAQVMLLRNIDVENELCNGTRGIVKECYEDSVDILLRNEKEVRIGKELFEYFNEEKDVVVSRFQLPLKLAWATTIHKSQGSTLDYAIIDLGYKIFSHSMAYVALSRVKSLDGLFLVSFDRNKIYTSKKVLEYEKTITI